MASQDPLHRNHLLEVGHITSSSTSIASAVWVTVQENPSIILVLVTVLFLSQIAYSALLHPLANIPGPFLASFSKLWIVARSFRGSWHDDILEIHRQYGPVVRIAPNEVSFVDSNALKILYGYGTGTPKTPWYNTWNSPGMAMSFFVCQDVAQHKFLRGRVASAYSMASLLSMESFIQEVGDRCWDKFRKYAAARQSLNLSEWTTYYTFDLVGLLAMGGEFGFVEKEKDVRNIISAMHNGTALLGNMGHVPLQMWWFDNALSAWLLDRFGSAELQAFPNLLKWLEAQVVDRMQSGLCGRRQDLLQRFIEMKGSPSKEPQPAAKSEVMVESLIVFAAGGDTTAFAIQTVLGNLVTHPEALTKVRQEVDQSYGDLGLDKTGNEIAYNAAAKLSYLAAVIKESLRLDPSFVYQIPRYTPDKGIQIGPHYLPKGIYAGVSPRAMNRSKDVFGEDADEFVPERWISMTSEDEESIKEMERNFMTFGMGSRACIGQNMAMIEIYKFVAQFVRHFEFELVDKNVPWTTKSATFAFRSNFWVHLTER